MKHYCRNRKKYKIIRDLTHVVLCSVTAGLIVIGIAQVASQAKGPTSNSEEVKIESRAVQSYKLPQHEVIASAITAPVVIKEFQHGYTNTSVNIREAPSTSSTILTTVDPFTIINYTYFNDEWYEIEYQESTAYIYSMYVKDGEVPDYVSYYLNSNGFKSFMGYKAITSKSSSQYKIQYNYAYTGEFGIRQVNSRFCVALGSGVNARIGTYVDLVLENGTIINCILSDQKDDKHTLDDNLTTAANGCVSEFIVDSSALESLAAKMGDISYACEEWRSPVVEIRVYPFNIFD